MHPCNTLHICFSLWSYEPPDSYSSGLCSGPIEGDQSILLLWESLAEAIPFHYDVLHSFGTNLLVMVVWSWMTTFVAFLPLWLSAVHTYLLYTLAETLEEKHNLAITAACSSSSPLLSSTPHVRIFVSIVHIPVSFLCRIGSWLHFLIWKREAGRVVLNVVTLPNRLDILGMLPFFNSQSTRHWYEW